MKRINLQFIFLLLTISTVFAFMQKTSDFNNEADKFLKQNVKNGKVNYQALKSNFADIDRLYNSLMTVDVKHLSENELKAFYINAYNIIVIHQITKYFPLKSALDRNGFFDKVKHGVAGENITLDQIEKVKVIIKYKDPLVHFAFSCAAIGCPELANFAFMPAQVDEQLKARVKNSVNNPDFIKVDDAKKEVNLSMILKWYEKDFLLKSESVIAYINQYRTTKIPANYTVNFYSYDWTLNTQ
jgi:hypothetical protein